MRCLPALLTLVAACAVTLLFPAAGSWAAGLALRHLGPWDPHGVYLWNTVHHLVQMGLALGCIALLGRPRAWWGLTLANRADSLRYTGQFLLWFGGIGLGVHVLLGLTAPPPPFPFPLDAPHILGNLGFKLLLTGPSEEILFRGLVMGILLMGWTGTLRVGRLALSSAGILTAVLFMAAHVGVDWSSLRITHLAPVQLVQAGALGLLYAWYRDRTGSLLAPILVHSLFNTLLTGFGLLWAMLAHS